MDAKTPDPIALLLDLTPEALLARIDANEAENKALLVLLRSARARERELERSRAREEAAHA